MKQLNWYQIFGKSNIPDGRTVLPTDDIQIWLHCANIWNKTYTTLGEVLADTTTLLALINSNNAVDYMVRSTTWAVSVSVPTMTDNTHPSGECFADYSYSAMPPYQAFDKNNATTWSHYGTLDLPAYIGYDFGTPVCVNRVMIHPVFNDGYLRIKTFKIQGSNDNSTYEDVYSDAFTANSSAYAIDNFFSFTNTKNYRYYRLLFVDVFNSGVNGVPTLCELQFYSPAITDDSTAMSYIGLNNYCANTLLADSTWCEAIYNSEYFESVSNVKVPAMTSNTTPSGECSASSSLESNPPYCAFAINKLWITNYGVSTPQYLQYKFDVPVCAHMFDFYNYVDGGYETATNLSVSASVDGVNFTSLGTFNNLPASTLNRNYFENHTEYTYYRLTFNSKNNTFGGGTCRAAKVNFYGREDV